MATTFDPFTGTASDKEGGDYERPDAGMYPAVCVALVDLGTRTTVYQSQAKDVREIYFAWELTNYTDSKGDTFVVAERFTNSLGKKSKLRPVIESWTGTKLGDGAQFRFGDLLDRPCFITLVENAGYTKIGAVGPVPKGIPVPPRTREPFIFTVNSLTSSAEGTDPILPDWLPWIYGKSVLEIIKASHEYGKLPAF